MIALNASTGTVITAVWLKRSPGSVGEPSKVESHTVQPGSQPDPSLPWFENAGSSAGLRFAARRLLVYSRATVYLQKLNFLKSFIFSLNVNNVVRRPVMDGTIVEEMIILHEEVELIFLFLPKIFFKKEVFNVKKNYLMFYIFLNCILLTVSCIFNNGPLISS